MITWKDNDNNDNDYNDENEITLIENWSPAIRYPKLGLGTLVQNKVKR